MELKKRIYCIEGFHDWGEEEVEPSVEPMLELLQKLGYWKEGYLYRTCSSRSELQFRLEQEWWKGCAVGSVLYFCTHGSQDQVWLRPSDQSVSVIDLKDLIGKDGAEGCHIHFGGCDTFSGGDNNLKEFMRYTKATSVSGYATDNGWLGKSKPATALELLFFSLLSEVNLVRNDRSRSKKLCGIREYIQDQFDDCKFEMLIRRYRRSS